MKLFRKWIIGKRTLKELVKESGKSIDTLRILFKKFLDYPPLPRPEQNINCHLTIDGTHFRNNFCVLVYYDSRLKKRQYFRAADQECWYNYITDLEYLKQVGLNAVSITSDGQKGLIKAVRDVFPRAIHQRCIIHIQRMALVYLTRFPKTEAGLTLRYWVKKLHLIENHDQKYFWISQFEGWRRKYDLFLKERSVSFSGRKWYTHKMLRKTRSLIKNALPNMFHYLDNPDIQKSSNGLEAQFSYLKNTLKIHRGLSRENQESFIRWYYYFKGQD
ncbi:transposase [Candidatus Falkowbacteria bacterium]|nr:transposase [Candidatus Falkowbacteria bacterium]